MKDLKSDVDRIAADDGVAIVFIHGILGTPQYFSFLRPFVPEGWHVCAITLKGHCGTVGDFADASMAEWKAQVSGLVIDLRRTYRRVVVAAHSMGTLFAIREAVDGRADALFLMNVPLSLRLSRRLFITPLKIFTGRADMSDKWMTAAVEAYGIADDRNLFHYIPWVCRYLELFAEIWHVRRLAACLDVETQAYFSAHDEMVSPSAMRFLGDSHKIVSKILPDSGHYYYSETDKTTLISDFKTFVAHIQP